MLVEADGIKSSDKCSQVEAEGSWRPAQAAAIKPPTFYPLSRSCT